MSTNKDQVRGRVKEAKGKIKEVVRKLVGNRTQEAKGKIQEKLGKAIFTAARRCTGPTPSTAPKGEAQTFVKSRAAAGVKSVKNDTRLK